MCLEGTESSRDEGNVSSNGDKIVAEDACMGKERNRTLVIGILLTTFLWFAFGAYINAMNDEEKEVKNAYIMAIVGIGIIFLSVVLSIIMYISGTKGMKKVVGIIFFIGGALYFVGFCFIMDWYAGRNSTGSSVVIQFGEAVLVSFTTVIVGVDLLDIRYCKIDCDVEAKRLSWNLALLAVVSVILGPAYAAESANSKEKFKTAYGFASFGWFIILIMSSLYVITMVCRICHWDKNFTLRLLTAIALMVGGGVTGFGYWILVGIRNEKARRVENGYDPQLKWYYIGLCIFVVGITVIWGLDMGLLDTVQKRSKKSSKNNTDNGQTSSKAP